jgi:aminoglycoside/choline kinase family phosphotransferase
MIMSERLAELQYWLADELGFGDFTIVPASSDASFRRYFRVSSGKTSQIVMDAPPDKEDCGPFINIASALADLGLNVPLILEADVRRGFLLMSDLGSVHYLQALNEQNVERLYGDALHALRLLQTAPVEDADLPDYDRDLLLREMALFRDWYLARHLQLAMGEALSEVLEQSFAFLADEALGQPRAWVHRDYHSRNLMVTEMSNPGILDFQDAVIGPVTYDLVSLLRDCYVRWPQERVTAWVRDYLALSQANGLLSGIDPQQFQRWFDLMGVQRHLKAIGIFARLNYRDGKPGYLPDIPRTLGYVLEVSERYSELSPLRRLLEELTPAQAPR